jgi:hypothetical protein
MPPKKRQKERYTAKEEKSFKQLVLANPDFTSDDMVDHFPGHTKASLASKLKWARIKNETGFSPFLLFIFLSFSFSPFL